jgi:hypothetical protein
MNESWLWAARRCWRLPAGTTEGPISKGIAYEIGSYWWRADFVQCTEKLLSSRSFNGLRQFAARGPPPRDAVAISRLNRACSGARQAWHVTC